MVLCHVLWLQRFVMAYDFNTLSWLLTSVLCYDLWLKWFVMTWDFSDLSWPHWAMPPAHSAASAVRCAWPLFEHLFLAMNNGSSWAVCLSLNTWVRFHVNNHASELSAWHSGFFFWDTAIAMTAVQCCLWWLCWNRSSRFQCCMWFYYFCWGFENTENWLFCAPFSYSWW